MLVEPATLRGRIICGFGYEMLMVKYRVITRYGKWSPFDAGNWIQDP